MGKAVSVDLDDAEAELVDAAESLAAAALALSREGRHLLAEEIFQVAGVVREKLRKVRDLKKAS